MSLTLINCGVPLCGLGKERGRTLRRLRLEISLVQLEDLTILLNILERCDAVS